MDTGYNFQYEAEAKSSYLVAVLESGTDIIQYQFKMLENNNIVNLLDVRKYSKNNSLRICYNVTSKISLSQALGNRKISKDEFVRLIIKTIETYSELMEYQLSSKGLILSMDYIFVKPGYFEPSFIYLPIYAEEDNDGLRSFVRNMILESRLESTNDNFVQKILDLFNDTGLTLCDIQKDLEAMLKPKIKEDIKQNPIQPPVVPVFDSPENVPDTNTAMPKNNVEVISGKRELKNKEIKKKNSDSSKIKAQTKVKKGSSKESTIFTAVQAVVVLLVAMLVKRGFFIADGGVINTSYAAGVFIMVAGLDVVLYRELFINKKSDNRGAAKRSAVAAKTAVKQKVKAQNPDVKPIEDKVKITEFAVNTDDSAYYAMDNIISEENDDTVVDDGSYIGECHLEYYENGLAKRIHLNEGVTRVGSRVNMTDYVIASNKVSKLHAEFIRRGNNCFVRDINSTNGTYINGSKDRIVSNTDIELHNGDSIRLANIELVYKC